MNIDLIAPLSAGYKRMKKALFQPFDLAKWFAIGFTAFLAGLTDCNGGSGGNRDIGYKNGNHDLDEFFRFPETVSQWLMEHQTWMYLIIIGIIFIVAIALVLTWVSSRGKFMFLYNVVHDKSEVVYPWKEYRKEGDSFFVWYFIFGLVTFGLFIFSAISYFDFFRQVYFEGGDFAAHLGSIFWMILSFLFFFVIIGFVSLILRDFVVPVMFKHRVSTNEAWKIMLPVLRKHIGYFIIYALFVLVLVIAMVLAIVVFGFLTCCIGFIVLIIPYLSSVLLLPVSYTFRAFSVEFLEQFGEDFKIFPEEEGANQADGLTST